MQIECKTIDERLLDYLYEEIEPSEKEALKTHIEGCARCKAELGAFGRVRKAVASDVALVEPPSSASAKILFQAAQLRPRPRGKLLSFLRPVTKIVRHPAYAMAATFLVIAGVTGWQLMVKGDLAPAPVVMAPAPAPTAATATAPAGQPVMKAPADPAKAPAKPHASAPPSTAWGTSAKLDNASDEKANSDTRRAAAPTQTYKVDTLVSHGTVGFDSHGLASGAGGAAAPGAPAAATQKPIAAPAKSAPASVEKALAADAPIATGKKGGKDNSLDDQVLAESEVAPKQERARKESNGYPQDKPADNKQAPAAIAEEGGFGGDRDTNGVVRPKLRELPVPDDGRNAPTPRGPYAQQAAPASPAPPPVMPSVQNNAQRGSAGIGSLSQSQGDLGRNNASNGYGKNAKMDRSQNLSAECRALELRNRRGAINTAEDLDAFARCEMDVDPTSAHAAIKRLAEEFPGFSSSDPNVEEMIARDRSQMRAAPAKHMAKKAKAAESQQRNTADPYEAAPPAEAKPAPKAADTKSQNAL